MRKHLTTLAIIVLALVAGSGVGKAQNNERIDNATKTTPNGSEQSGFTQTQVNNLQGEIAKFLRMYHDAWTKLDATVVNNNFTDDGFVSIDGKMNLIRDPDYAKRPKATIKRPINLGFEEGKVP
jgi:hypothetical protein